MLQKITLRARRSYNWICSDCQKRLDYNISSNINIDGRRRTIRSFKSSTPTLDKTTLPWRRPVMFLGVSNGNSVEYGRRWYSKDGGQWEDEDSRLRELEELEKDSEEHVEGQTENPELHEPLDEEVEEFLEDLDNPSKDVEDIPSPHKQTTYPYQRYKPDHPEKLNYVFIADPDLEDEKPRNIATEAPIPRKVAAELQDPTRAPDWTRTLSENRQLRRKPPVTRASLLKDLERMNARLAKGGLQLIDPPTSRRHKRVISRPHAKTAGYEDSIWQKFKVDYARRYRQGDPTVFLGRPENWKPTRGELRVEYSRYFLAHVENATQWYAQRRHWWNAPDLRLCFANSLHMLERYTSVETIQKYRFRWTPYGKIPLEEAGGSFKEGDNKIPLDNLAHQWQRELVALEPDGYQFIETTVQEREQLMSSMKHWAPSGFLPKEIDEFRLEYMEQVDIEALAKVFGVNIDKKLPLSSTKLSALLKSLVSLRVSKQDLRYLIPPGYNNSADFISSTIVSLILSHEQNNVLNTQIFNTAINYLMRVNQIKKGRHLIDLMDHLKINMNVGTFREALLAAAKNKDLFVFERLLRRLMSKKLKFDHETWKALLECCHTPGQQFQVFQSMKKIGLDPKRLAPGALISLTFKMYKDQIRHGNTDIPVPWKNLAGIHLDASTLNPILEFLYENYAYDEARTLFYRASRELKMQPNHGTLRIITRQARITGRIVPMVRAIRIFESKFGIEAGGDVMQMIFQQAHRLRYYNIVRTVWAHACLRNKATKGMIDRMRADIYETGQSAGKPGKLALGICSEDTEAVVKTPVWAMRLVSKARDPLGYLASEGGIYRNPEVMRDLEQMEERDSAMRQFQKKAIKIRMELLRMDLSCHHKFKPRRSFSADLVAALRRDRFLRTKHPQCHNWSMLTWAWSLFQVRRVNLNDNVEQILIWERIKKRQEEARSAGRHTDEEMIWARNYALLNNMPTHLSVRWLDLPSMNTPPIESSRVIPDMRSLTQADIERLEKEKEEEKRMLLAGKEDLYAFYEHIISDDLDGLEFSGDGGDDDDDEVIEAHFDNPLFLEREMGPALADAIESWQEPPITIEDEDEIEGEKNQNGEDDFFWDDHDKVHTEAWKRKEAGKEADLNAQIRADFEAAYRAALPKDERKRFDSENDVDYKSTREM